MHKTIDYYNVNAQEFNNSTFFVDMTNIYHEFLRYLKPNSYLLDVGCGSGRDSLFFKNSGYFVDAFDYSLELVKIARQQTGIEVKHQSFLDLDQQDQYDGIWACASLLHCERSELPQVLLKIIKALKINGICYMSFKYGCNTRLKDNRLFTDLNETDAYSLLKIHPILLLQQWISIDKRPDRNEEWLNIIFKKIE